MSRNYNILSTHLLPALLTSLPFKPLFHLYLLVLKKLLVVLIKRLMVLKVSVIPSTNTFESFNDFKILIIMSFIFSFEINTVNPVPAPTAPFPFIFLSNLLIAFEAYLLTNPGKLSLAKRIAT